jgi:hypothetical protein
VVEIQEQGAVHMYRLILPVVLILVTVVVTVELEELAAAAKVQVAVELVDIPEQAEKEVMVDIQMLVVAEQVAVVVADKKHLPTVVTPTVRAVVVEWGYTVKDLTVQAVRCTPALWPPVD